MEFDIKTNEELYDHTAFVDSGKNEVSDDETSTKDNFNTEEGRVKTWKTDLGETMDWNKKLTIRDLGKFMGERFKQAMSSSEGINYEYNNPNFYGGALLASPGDFSSNDEKRWDSDTTRELNNMYEMLVEKSRKNYGITSKDNTNDNFKEMERYSGPVGDLGKSYSDWLTNNGNAGTLRMGSSKVLNPDFQFNELDDVRSDFRRPFLGRLFSERIYDYNLPIVYFQPGTVSIDAASVNLLSKRANAQFVNLQKYLKSETNPLKWVGTKLGNGITALMSTGSKLLLDLGQWWKWTSQSLMYIRYVNEMLLELAEWMGLFASGSDDYREQTETEASHSWFESLKAKLRGGENVDAFNDDEIFSDGSPFVSSNHTEDGEQPKFLNGAVDKETGVQIHKGYFGRIQDLTEKNTADVGAGADPNDGLLSVLHILPDYEKMHGIFPALEYGEVNVWDNKDENDKNENGWRDYTLTVPLAISNTVSVSESFDNSTSAHPLTERYASQFEQASNAQLAAVNPQLMAAEAFDSATSGGGLSDVAMEALKDVGTMAKDKAKQFVNNTAAGHGLSGEAGMVMTGAGRFILPEVWSDSSFSRSYSMTFKFRSPYGNKLSIFENTFVPLIFLMGMAIPRKVAIQSYTNPFYVRSFSKGLFSIELGMITSLSISRGEEKNDRTFEQLFRSISVSVSVKDMLSNVPIGLDGGLFGISKASNNGMFNYMANLAGIDFVQRANLSHNVNVAVESMRNEYHDFYNKANIALNSKLKLYASPMSWFGKVTSPTTGGGVSHHKAY